MTAISGQLNMESLKERRKDSIRMDTLSDTISREAASTLVVLKLLQQLFLLEKPLWRSGYVTRLVIQGSQVRSRASPVLRIETINRGPISI